jgi:hypothetical protein
MQKGVEKMANELSTQKLVNFIQFLQFGSTLCLTFFLMELCDLQLMI